MDFDGLSLYHVHILRAQTVIIDKKHALHIKIKRNVVYIILAM